MRLLHNVEIRVFSKEKDDHDLIIDKLKAIANLDFQKEKLILRAKTAYGFEDKKIKILTLFLKKQKHTSAFVKNLISNLNDEQKGLILRQLDSRLDDKLHFYLRLQKDNLLKDEYFITDSGNCFHIKMAIAAYPHRKEAAKDILKKIFR